MACMADDVAGQSREAAPGRDLPDHAGVPVGLQALTQPPAAERAVTVTADASSSAIVTSSSTSLWQVGQRIFSMLVCSRRYDSREHAPAQKPCGKLCT